MIISTLLFSQDIAGSYQFYGLYVVHQSLARYNTPIMVSDTYGLGINSQVGQLNEGEIYRTTYQGPYGHLYAQALNVVLNVDFNADGTGNIVEGSYYPTETVENCIASIAILPITDNLVYTSNLDAGLTIPNVNILGSLPDGVHDHPSAGFLNQYNIPIYAESSSGSISLSTSEVFDFFPASPIQPTLCDDAGNCFDVTLENGQTISGGDPLPGFAGGYVKKGELESIAPQENCCSNLYVEWHAIDGPISGSGLGDIIGEDEDGDGTDFDRIWAMESLMATYLNPSCGYNYPIFGDLTDNLDNMGLSECLDRVDIAIEGYVFNEANNNHGYLVTMNSIQGQNGNDDSDHDYNGTDGRLVMKFEPMCIQDINVRHMMLEFIEIGAECCVPDKGDVNSDGGWNVLDIVALANWVLDSTCSGNNSPCDCCAADINEDSGYNVLDIVALANCVLSESCGD